jgi:predicted transcriptional regulator
MDNIQFLTRKEATCQDLLSCLYNLKTIDLEVFREVAKREWATLDQIAESVSRDRSSTHRCLSKLVSAGLVHKQSEGLKAGGYYHIYSIVEPSKIKEDAKQKVKEITDSLQALINNFDTDLSKHLGNDKLN